MKRLLMASIVLFLFSLSILIIQSSCTKSKAQQNRPVDVTQTGKIAFIKKWSIDAEIWTANFDGTNAARVPISLPANVSMDANCCTASLSISPDGQKIFFSALNTTGGTSVTNIYSCDIDGSDVSLVIQGTPESLGKVCSY